jgi:hypothetical protein
MSWAAVATGQYEGTHGGVPERDPDLLGVLRLLKAAFEEIEVVDVIDDTPGWPQPAQGWLFDDGGPAPYEFPGQADER